MLDMGEPVRIVDLATDLIRLSGLELGRDIDITYTGLRPGEKPFEELFLDGEEYRRTEHEQIFIAANASTFVPHALDHALAQLYDAARSDQRHAIVEWLRALVPEYVPNGSPAGHAAAVRPLANGVNGSTNGQAH